MWRVFLSLYMYQPLELSISKLREAPSLGIPKVVKLYFLLSLRIVLPLRHHQESRHRPRSSRPRLLSTSRNSNRPESSSRTTQGRRCMFYSSSIHSIIPKIHTILIVYHLVILTLIHSTTLEFCRFNLCTSTCIFTCCAIFVNFINLNARLINVYVNLEANILNISEFYNLKYTKR